MVDGKCQEIDYFGSAMLHQKMQHLYQIHITLVIIYSQRWYLSKIVTFMFLYKKNSFLIVSSKFLSFLVIFLKFFQNYTKITPIQIFSEVSSKFLPAPEIFCCFLFLFWKRYKKMKEKGKRSAKILGPTSRRKVKIMKSSTRRECE